MGQVWSETNCIVDGVPTLGCIFPLFNNVLNALLFLASIVALFFIIWAGLKLIRSNGDAKQVDGARKTLTFAIVGLILVFLSFLIINFLSFVTGVNCIKEFSFNECGGGTTSSHAGQVGCFDVPGAGLGCYPYNVNNNPPTPRAWYPDNASCQAVCR